MSVLFFPSREGQSLPKFTSQTSAPENAVVVSFDVCGFSEFCKKPDAAVVLPKFMSAMFECLRSSLEQKMEWNKHAYDSLPEPTFIKFTGDGAILIWTQPAEKDFTPAFRHSVVAHIHWFRHRFESAAPTWGPAWNTRGLPTKLRVGIACGAVHPLKVSSVWDSSKVYDYVGYCINLAVRLQDQWPDVGLLVHGNLHVDGMPGLHKGTAPKMKGAVDEEIYFFEWDAEKWLAAARLADQQRQAKKRKVARKAASI